MDLGLAGRVALVTGSSWGSGRHGGGVRPRGRASSSPIATTATARRPWLTRPRGGRRGDGGAVRPGVGRLDPRRGGCDARAVGRIDVLVNNAVAWGRGAAGRAAVRTRPTSGGPAPREPEARCGRSSSWRCRCGPGVGADRERLGGIAVDGVPRSGVVRPGQGRAVRPHAHAGHEHGPDGILERGQRPASRSRRNRSASRRRSGARGRALAHPSHPPA